MKKYRVTAHMTISVHVDVEAKSKTEARDKAREAGTMTLCHQCADGDDELWSTSGELDGEPKIIEVEEI